jgi:hypothetical protein
MTTAAATDNVHGIAKKKIDEQAVNDALAQLRIEVPKKADLPKRVGMLKQFFETQNPSDISNCDECQADSLTSLSRCPFCGSGEAETNGALTHTNGAALVLKAAPELDAHVAEIRSIQQQTGRVGWLLCKAIADGVRSNVWKSRVDGAGKVAYKTYEQFAAAELGMSKKYVQSLIRIYERFIKEVGGKELVEQVGTSKLRLLIAAPPEKQEDVLEKIKKGASKREVAKAARDEKKPAKAKASATPSGKRATITVAAIEGKGKFRLYAKPANPKEAFDEKTAKRAKRMTDTPWGWLDLTNDVRVDIAMLTDAAGDMFVRYHIHREE